MFRRAFIVIAVGAVALSYLQVKSVEAVPAFARQYDLQCNACHTRPPRLNRFGEQFHMMGFQIPSAARPEGLIGSLRDDGPVKTLIDSLALRIEGGLFEYTGSPRESETKFAPPDEITLFVTRPLLPELSIFVEIEGEPNTVAFENGRYFTRGQFGLGKEAFFMLNFGRLLGLLGAPTMEMGGQTMVGQHGGFSMHGPMLMAGKVDPNTNFSYATNRQLIAPTELEVAHGAVERLPVVPYVFASKFFGLFKNRDEREPQLVTDQLMYKTSSAPGADFLVHEKVMLSSRFDQLWAGGLKDEKRDGSVLSLQAKFYPWQNIAFFVRDSVNLRSFVEDSPLRNWRNQVFIGIDWDF